MTKRPPSPLALLALSLLALAAPLATPALAQIPTPPSFDRPRPPQVPDRPRPPEGDDPAQLPFLEPPADPDALADWAEGAFPKLRAQGMRPGGNERPWLLAVHHGVEALRASAGLRHPWADRRAALAALAAAAPLNSESRFALEGELLADELSQVREGRGPTVAGGMMNAAQAGVASALPHALVAQMVALAGHQGPVEAKLQELEAHSANLTTRGAAYPDRRLALTGMRVFGASGRLRHQSSVQALANQELRQLLGSGFPPPLRRNRIAFLYILGDLPQLP